MSIIVYTPMPRYVVEIAGTDSGYGTRLAGRWDFAYAFNSLDDATAMAGRLAEENEFVRVIDRTPTDNEENR